MSQVFEHAIIVFLLDLHDVDTFLTTSTYLKLFPIQCSRAGSKQINSCHCSEQWNTTQYCAWKRLKSLYAA